MKKLATALTVVLGSLFIASSASAEFFSVSLGVPVSHSFSDPDVVESDGMPSGVFAAAKLPILVGLGYENYNTPIKSDGDLKLNTTMYDLFYLLPIPIINLTIGVGAGTTEFDCATCSQVYDSGTATQVYASLGLPLFVVMDFHVSYRSVNSKIKTKSGSDEYDISGNVAGVGISIGF
jgi:hypothetical protein